MSLRFKDTVTIYEPSTDSYGNTSLGTATVLTGLLVQATGYTLNRPAVTSASILHLPDDSYLQGKGYRLEGYVVKVDPFGSTSDQYYRISSVSPARDVLRANVVHHVECELTKIAEPV